MIKQILFPFDFSAQSLKAAASVQALAARLDASVTVLSVVPLNLSVMPLGMEADVTRWRRSLQARLDDALATELAGVTVTRITEAGDPGTRITEVAHKLGVDLIMMPTHGLGLFRALLVGSATSKVLHDAACAVWTEAHAEQLPPGGLPKSILCAVDDGPHAAAVLRWAADFSARVGASLEVLHVVSLVPDWPTPGSERALGENLRDESRARLTSALDGAGIKAPLHISIGNVVQSVIDHAREQKADLILIGRGHLPTGRLRTHAYGIIQRSGCPVLSV